MLCKNPYMGDGMAYGCGQCHPCRFNRRRIWMHRIMLEAAQHECNAFVTLTYADDRPQLCPKDCQDWLKRLRARVAPSTFRFFLVGEYGDASQRPHYHAALFGFPSCAYGQSRYSKRVIDCCYWCDLVRDTWSHGFVFLGSLEAYSAGYMAGYVTKKMTAKDDPRLEGRYPEFARMSLRPGIGGDAVFDVADVLMRFGLDETMLDVPVALQHGMKKLPLGRYLRKRLREAIGKDGKISQAAFSEMEKELFVVRLAALQSDEDPSLKSQWMKRQQGKLWSFERRQRIYNKGVQRL